jgi:nickel/cobalt transporter (NicO) family protein
VSLRAASIIVAAAVLAFAAPSASAHPLGNFSMNHLSAVSVSSDRVDVTWTLDQAEIPTVQERGLTPAAIVDRKRAEVARGLVLTVDGRRVPLTLAPGGRISFPPGQAGLATTRVELALSARVNGPRRVQLLDDTFPGRVGWKAIIARPGRGTAVRSSVPSQDITGGLRRYPADMLKSPLDDRTATFAVSPGDGTLVAPRAQGGGDLTTPGGGDGFAGIFSDAASGRSALILLLFAAFGWGAVHALSPGHGKAMVAAYLVGTRGTSRHAVALGLTVTITHTIGVFALGAVTLALSQYVVPEQLYPWLTLVSALLVLVIGLGVLRSRMRAARHHHHDHHHGHHHDEAPGWKAILGLGASAGLIPCPSALVVLLGAIAQHQVALGLLLIVVFSTGLAATLTGLGLAVVHARRLTARIDLTGRAARALPAASALAIVVVGCVLMAQAVPQVV